MKDFSATVFATASKQLAVSQPFIWLVEVEVPTDPATRYRLTNYNETVQRGTNSDGDPVEFSPYPIAFGNLRATNAADLESITINVANVALELMENLEAYDGLVGQPVALRLVNLEGLADENAELRFDGQVTGVVVNERVATFTVGCPNLTKSLFPRNRYVAHHCQWRFGSPECGYIIPAVPGETVGTGFSTCGRTLAQCEERGDDEDARGLTIQHPERFGGYPGIRQAAGQ